MQNLENLIAREVGLSVPQINAVQKLLNEGATVPFIARYRKSITKGLNEEQIRKIQKKLKYFQQLQERKETIIKTLQLQGNLTDELKEKILNCYSATELEDIYLPYKPKRRTKAQIARENGLEPLSEEMFSATSGNKEEILRKFINENIATPKEALRGAQFIIAEKINENTIIRSFTRNYLQKDSVIVSERKPTEHADAYKYEIYFNFEIDINKIKPHQILAINRAEKQKILKVFIDFDEIPIIKKIEKELGISKSLLFYDEIKEATELSLQRYLIPAIEREIRKQLTEKAEISAIKAFATNLKNLLLQPPIYGHNVLGIDPGYASGCKLAAIDKYGKFIESSVIYPTPPKKNIRESGAELLRLIYKHNITLIAIGNGTASRETEQFVAEVIRKNKLEDVKYIIVNEAGASVYSASKIAKEEFPDLDVTERGTISIARRVIDPLAELVKIEPKSLSVGLYQHDVNQNALQEELTNVVESVVNEVGVDLNTASYALLSYVSGLNKQIAKNIVKFRENNGEFRSRQDLLQVPGIGPKTFEQAAGFLKIRNSEEPLDNTQIHPESYEKVKQLAEKIKSIPANKLQKILEEINLDKDTYDLILRNLQKPGRDPREELPAPILRSDVLTIDDLNIGAILKGTVRNVVDFGAFVDIGLKNDALLHISKLGRRVKSPHEILKVGDVIEVKIINIDKERGRVSLELVN